MLVNYIGVLTSQSTLMPYEASMLMSIGSVESTDVLDGANTREIDASVLQMVLRDFSRILRRTLAYIKRYRRPRLKVF